MIAQKWVEFLQVTQSLTQANSISGIIPEKELFVYHALIADVIRQFAQDAKPANGLKTFVNGQQAIQYNSQLLQDPPKSDETLEEWAHRFFKDCSFGMIMNFLENYSNELVAKIGQGVAPLIENAGVPFRGLSNLFFLGNYGFTPFGAHKGTFGEDGFLFHLGPAPKVFYTWDTQEYLSLTGGIQGCRDYDKIMPYAKAYVLYPGDAMFIPSDVFHLANTETFSVSLILDYRKSTHEMVKRTLLEQLLFDQSDDEKLVKPLTTFSFQNLGIDFTSNFELAFKRQMALLRSNACYATPARHVSLHTNMQGPFELKIPFQLVHERLNNRDYLYARGHEFAFDDYPKMKPVIEALNQGKSMNWNTAQELLPMPVSMAEFIQLVALLTQTDLLNWL